jgi:single-stranded-DNA-specific exonuclease
MEKRWTVLSAPESSVAALQEGLKIHPVLCRVLAARGIDSFEKARDFFRPTLEHLHSPWLMKDMDKAVQRITTAFEQQEKLLIYGDYDVDGTTAVATLYRFLQPLHPLLDFYIPHRYREGYGISRQGIDFAIANGFSLIIALDCGIKSTELITYAKANGVDFIVCDHHLPDDMLPPAAAILNPKQPACPYPYKELCGCGIGFKLICALAEQFEIPLSEAMASLDLVATAIAADIVPITGENRILAHFGLKKVNENPLPGIKALVTLGGLKKALGISNLVFVIAPRVNAAGRMDDARKAVQLFIEDDEHQAMHFAEMLHSDNTDRKEADSNITEEALEIIRQDPQHATRRSTVVFRDHWHKGVVGIVASRLIEHYYRPTVVLTASNGLITGSARSVRGFNVYEAIDACRTCLLNYGGHFYAAGLTLSPDQLTAFREAFEAVVSERITPEQLIPEIIIDATLRFSDLKYAFYNILKQMEPFGPENMRPVFVARGVQDTGYSKVVKEEHLRLVVMQDGISFTGIGFGMAHHLPLLQMKTPVDIVFTVDENEWNGEKSLQLKLIDIRLSEKK